METCFPNRKGVSPSPTQRLAHWKYPWATQSILTIFRRRPSDSRSPEMFPSLPGLLFTFLESELGAHSVLESHPVLTRQDTGAFPSWRKRADGQFIFFLQHRFSDTWKDLTPLMATTKQKGINTFPLPSYRLSVHPCLPPISSSFWALYLHSEPILTML